jgi:hypothetical protein
MALGRRPHGGTEGVTTLPHSLSPAADRPGQRAVSGDKHAERGAVARPGPLDQNTVALGGACLVVSVGHHTMVVAFRALRVSTGRVTDRGPGQVGHLGPHRPSHTLGFDRPPSRSARVRYATADVLVPPSHGEWIARTVPGGVVRLNDLGYLGDPMPTLSIATSG